MSAYVLRCLLLSTAAVLTACGSGSSPTSTAAQSGQGAALAPQGYYAASNSDESFEFYNSPDVAPYNGLHTGRVFAGGQSRGLFWWTSNNDGSVTVHKALTSCATRPIDQCPETGRITITADAAGTWKLAYDDDHDGTAERTVTANFQRAKLTLKDLPDGQFFLNHGEAFDQPWQGFRKGNQIGIRMVLLEQPIAATGTLGDDDRLSLDAGGEAAAVRGTTTFNLVAGGSKALSVKQWIENVTVSAGANNGVVVAYEVHRKILFPSDVPASSVQVGSYEQPQLRSIGFGRVDHFVHGPTIAAGDKFDTFLPVDFDQDVVLQGAGNTLEFTSATEGVLSHNDLHNGKYTERRRFTWTQKTDGTVVLTYPSGLALSVRWVKPVTGGYSVLYSIPHPTLGTTYLMHDLIVDGPPILSEADIPGRYSFLSSDGVTQQSLVLHKDHTVTGVVGGFWLRDTDGTFVGYECRDIHNVPITDYATCVAQLDQPQKNQFVHIRHLKFLARSGNEIALKYDADVYGEEFGVVDRDYLTVALTYRFQRLGDE